jgi:hypothetical protein
MEDITVTLAGGEAAILEELKISRAGLKERMSKEEGTGEHESPPSIRTIRLAVSQQRIWTSMMLLILSGLRNPPIRR